MHRLDDAQRISQRVLLTRMVGRSSKVRTCRVCGNARFQCRNPRSLVSRGQAGLQEASVQKRRHRSHTVLEQRRGKRLRSRPARPTGPDSHRPIHLPALCAVCRRHSHPHGLLPTTRRHRHLQLRLETDTAGQPIVDIAHEVALRGIGGCQRPMRPLGSDCKCATVQVHQYRMRPGPSGCRMSSRSLSPPWRVYSRSSISRVAAMRCFIRGK